MKGETMNSNKIIRYDYKIPLDRYPYVLNQNKYYGIIFDDRIMNTKDVTTRSQELMLSCTLLNMNYKVIRIYNSINSLYDNVSKPIADSMDRINALHKANINTLFVNQVYLYGTNIINAIDVGSMVKFHTAIKEYEKSINIPIDAGIVLDDKVEIANLQIIQKRLSDNGIKLASMIETDNVDKYNDIFKLTRMLSHVTPIIKSNKITDKEVKNAMFIADLPLDISKKFNTKQNKTGVKNE